ncbi:MAG: trehalose-phosphatase [Candidatus Omnitrophica bacterium]|nr:trehalose-phosphatase [Candidatus Omnitrophota bacterium]
MGGKILRRIKKDLAARIKGAKRVIFFLDYDGTLVPIKKRPSLAKIHKNTKNLLKKLANTPPAKIFIISGRSLQDVKKLVGIKSLYYIGNHGIELEGPRLKYLNKSANALKTFMQKSCQMLKKRVHLRGVVLEDKTYTLSLHYRLVDPGKVKDLKKVFFETLKHAKSEKKIKVTEGKKVLEVRPNINWDKGKILNQVLRGMGEKGTLAICIGDDKTDEDAFRALGKKGISIVVSRKARKTLAQYRLNSPKEVFNLLKWCRHELVG